MHPSPVFRHYNRPRERSRAAGRSLRAKVAVENSKSLEGGEERVTLV